MTEVVVTTPSGQKCKTKWEQHDSVWICAHAASPVAFLSKEMATAARMRHLRDLHGFKFSPDLSLTLPPLGKSKWAVLSAGSLTGRT